MTQWMKRSFYVYKKSIGIFFCNFFFVGSSCHLVKIIIFINHRLWYAQFNLMITQTFHSMKDYIEKRQHNHFNDHMILFFIKFIFVHTVNFSFGTKMGCSLYDNFIWQCKKQKCHVHRYSHGCNFIFYSNFQSHADDQSDREDDMRDCDSSDEGVNVNSHIIGNRMDYPRSPTHSDGHLG